MEQPSIESVTLSASFLERFLVQAPAESLRLYLCVRAAGQQGRMTVTQAAQLLGCTPEQALESALYFQQQGLWQVEDWEIRLPYRQTPAPVLARRPNYEPKELQMYAEKNEEVRRLFAMAQTYLGRMLTHHDLSMIFSLYHWLGLSIEVIEILLRHCVSLGHRNASYIEKVALDWVESGITTVQAAKERVAFLSGDFRQILAAFGQGARMPAPSEQELVEKWRNHWGFSLPVIVYACEKTVEATGKPAFRYADRILENWKKAGVHTVEEAKAAAEAFYQGYRKTESARKPSAKPSSFGAYTQRQYDYEAFEAKQQDRLKGED